PGIFFLWANLPQQPDPAGTEPQPMEHVSPIIELHDARIFQRENLVLNHVDLTVHAGEFIYLVGRTGSGKSSLMRTLYGDLPFQEGEGHVAGFDLRKLKRRQVPRSEERRVGKELRERD